MNKNKLLLLASFLLTVSVTIWSCKDDFSAEDQLRLQAELDEQARKNAKDDAQEKDSIALSIQVYNASTSTHSNGGRTSSVQGASGITVKLTAQGEVLSATTGAEGIANFWVQPGSISGTLSGSGLATANFTLSVSEAEDGNEDGQNGETVTNASVVLPVFANTGSTVATVSGAVTFEGDLLNDAPENVPDGTVVTFKPNTSSIQSYYSPGIVSNNADIDAYSFEGNFIATTTNGAYTIGLPSGADGLEYTYTFNDFTADQRIAINQYDNTSTGSVRDVVTIKTNFGSGVGTSSIPNVRPIQFDIQAPPASGSGATVNLRLMPQSIGGIFSVMAKGSGYPANSNTVPVTISGGDFDSSVPGAQAASLEALTNSLGQVFGINVLVAGYGYRSRPTLTIGGGGTGAVVRVEWSSIIADDSYPDGPSTITAAGSGYLEDNPPTILVTGYSVDNDIVNTVFINTQVSNGQVVGISSDLTFFSSIISAVVVSPERYPATIANYGLSNLGELSYVIILNSGAGYSHTTLPTVTVRDLRGNGTGATVLPRVVDHAIIELYVSSRGSEYTLLGNANYPTSIIGFSPSTSPINLVAGQQKVLDCYYGTGRRTVGAN